MLKSFSRFRVLFAGVAVVGALVAAGVVTASVVSPGRVLALPGATESTVVTVEPTRVLDTRYNIGVTGKFDAGTSKKLMVTGTIDTWIEANQQEINRVVVPAGATGVLLNVTAVLPTGAGFISVRPGDATGAPSTSNLNVAPGDIVPNQVTVAIPTSGVNKGEIDITYGSAPNNTVDIVVDVVGYTTNTGLIDLVNRVEQLETVSPARVIWVADDNTGDYASLSAALDSIEDAAADKPYVIKIAPGIYTENSNVAMKNYVDVEGSGQNTTTINCACSTDIPAVISATTITAEIRHLTINNTGGGFLALGVYTDSVADGSFSMLHVTATATGSTGNYGVYNTSSSPSMNNVTATTTGGTTGFGVYNFDSSSPSMNNVTATATDGIGNYGVYNTSSSPSMNNVTATGEKIANSSLSTAFGVYNSDSFSPVISSSSPVISSSPSIRNSSITGSTASISNVGTSNAKVADTALGGAVAGNGFFCVGVYDTDFAAANDICVIP